VRVGRKDVGVSGEWVSWNAGYSKQDVHDQDDTIATWSGANDPLTDEVAEVVVRVVWCRECLLAGVHLTMTTSL